MLRKFLILCLLWGIIFLYACQPTPDDPVVISKGDGELQHILAADPAAELSDPYHVSQKWNETVDGLKESKLVIEVDADITVPQALSYPVFRVAQASLTQETANDFIRYFIGNEKLYDYGDREYSDEHLQSIIDMAEYSLNDPSSPLNSKYIDDIGVAGGMHEFLKGNAMSWRDMAMEQLAKAHIGKEVWPLFDNATPEKLINEDGVTKEYLSVFTCNLDNRISLKDSASGRSVIRQLNSEKCMYLVGTYAVTENLIGLKTNIEDAKKQASVVLNGLGYGDWNLVSIGAVGIKQEDFFDIVWDWNTFASSINQPQSFWLTYTPNVFEDIPLLYYSNNDSEYSKGQLEMLNNRDNYAPPSGFQPSLHLAVGDDGVSYVALHSAMDILDTVNTNVPLISFEEIQEIFRRYILLQSNLSFDWGRDSESEIDPALEKTIIRIKDVKLGYMKVREKNGVNDLLLPVWMFYGTQHDRYTSQSATDWALDENNERVMETPAGFTFLIINAIDGSIIDPLLGY